MKVELFSVCDYASDTAGKLILVGVFDIIWMAEIPGNHPIIYVATRIRFETKELPIKLQSKIIDPKGKVLGRSETVMDMKLPEGFSEGAGNLVVAFINLRFEAEGKYKIQLSIDGKDEAELPLIIKKR